MSRFYPTFVDKKRTGYVPGVDSNIDDIMREWQPKYCKFSDTSICISTFNVNGRSPPSAIPEWFPNGAIADFYAIGLQEMDLSVGTYISNNTKKMEEWLSCIVQSLPGGSLQYKTITSMRLVGIFVVLFQSKTSSIRVSNVQANCIATGISVLGNKLGNKGGTGISLSLNDTTVCFVNCHLAAGNGELERRNQDFRDIVDMKFPTDSRSIYDHDVVFWFGDLNYRINAEQAGLTGDQVRLIASGVDFKSLIQFDQLREQQLCGAVFRDFREPDSLKFRPTYKYDPGTSVWDSSEKARAPAWCDRVLYWVREESTTVKQKIYDSVDTVVISDHKPVRAGFMLKIRDVDQKKADALYPEAIREADRQANERLPRMELSETEVDFGEVRFLQHYIKNITLKNVGISQVRFKFLNRDGSGNISAGWLKVVPSHFTIPVGSSTQVTLSVVIDKRIAWELNETELQDILVIKLINGRDFFIPVVAKYYPRCFGVTIERLLSNKGTTSANLIDFGEATDSTDLSPPNVPRELYRLVSALQLRTVESLDLSENSVQLDAFIRIRTALEENEPKDLNKLAEIRASDLYQALLRLIDSLKFPLIPEGRQEEFKSSCQESGRLWAIVTSLPPVHAAVIEYLIGYLTELVRVKSSAEDLLSTWADVFFRDRSIQASGSRVSPFTSDPRAIALRSLCAYGKDVAIFHSQSEPRFF